MRTSITRRSVLRGFAASPVTLALPPLETMFGSGGTAWAADGASVEPRFVLWFNGNGIPERYWIPAETGPDFALTPCLAPLAPFRDDIHVITGLDNPSTRIPGAGNDHVYAMSGLLTCSRYTGRGAGGTSIDQIIASRIGRTSRIRSLEIGVAQESYGDSIMRNMSWMAADRPLQPEMLPNRLFDRLFGQRELGWVARQKSVLDAVGQDAARLARGLGKSDRARLDEHMSSVRDLERAITSLPAHYRRVDAPDAADTSDMRDYPRIAKLQSDLLVHALASGQTRVATYMLTKCEGITRFPWLGRTVLWHHTYTHHMTEPGTGMPCPQAMRDICRWHTDEFAYLVGKLKAVPEGDGTLLDHTCLLMVHEHAEAGAHKCTGLGMVLAGHAGKLRTGLHTRAMGTVSDLYLTLANDVLGAGLQASDIPLAERKLPGIWAT